MKRRIAPPTRTRTLATTFLYIWVQSNFQKVNCQQAPFPYFRFILWDDLDASTQSNADILGYNDKKWDKPGKAKIEEKSFGNLKEDEQNAAKAIGFTEKSWDCWMNHYLDFQWTDLQDMDIAQYLLKLGWTQASWEEENPPDIYEGDWRILSVDEQSAAIELCYFQQLWNEKQISDDWPTSPLPSLSPTSIPTLSPSLTPTTTLEPTPISSSTPSHYPSVNPSSNPTLSAIPTKVSSESPTLIPSSSPTVTPSGLPTTSPSEYPTTSSSPSVTSPPTILPIISPSIAPTTTKTNSPSIAPTITSTTVEPSKSDDQTTIEGDDSTISNIDYFEKPSILWTAELPKNHSSIDSIFSRSERTPVLSHGNGVVLSPDSKLLYVTRSDGGLNVLSATNGELVWAYMPEPNANAWKITCTSQVYFGENHNVGQFLVYAIVDQAPQETDLDSQSRIVAISIPDHSHLWTSPPIEGIVAGTPVITRNFLSGEYIFIVHNTGTAPFSTAAPEGHFSILVTDHGGTRLFTESSSFVSPNNVLPYGPMGVSHFPARGKYDLGKTNSNDLVVWTTNTKDGNGGWGQLRAFQIPAGFDESGDDLFTVRLRSVSWNAIARPTLSNDGLRLFAGVRRGEVRGWVGNRNFTDIATWKQQLGENSASPTKGIPSAGVLSIDEKRLFIPSSTNKFYALDTENGDILWHGERSSTIFTEGAVSPDDQRVYSIESSSGTVYSQSQLTGMIDWYFKGGYRPVQAEWCLSVDGLILYYGDTYGRVQALSLGSKPDGSIPNSTVADSEDSSSAFKNDHEYLSWNCVLASIATLLLFL